MIVLILEWDYMRFARWIFLAAGISGVIMLLPAYFLEQQYGHDYPPAVNHPEFFYGFFGVTLAWQVMFLVIASDPIRFRLAMVPAMLEKASFAVAIPVLFVLGRTNVTVFTGSLMDSVWLVLFIFSYARTPKENVR